MNYVTGRYGRLRSRPSEATSEVRTRSAPARPMNHLVIRAAAETWNEGDRTVEVIISTGADVLRRDARGVYVERPDLPDPATLLGLPVLDNHKRGSALDVLGTVAAAWIEDGKLLGRIQFVAAPDITPYADRLRAGALSVSMGYGESNVRETVEDGRRVRTFTPVIREVSIVAIPADRGAKVRSRPMSGEDIEVEVTPTDGVEAAKIRSLAELAKKPDQWAENVITRGLGVDDARALIHAEAMEATKAAPKIRTASVGASNDDPAVVHRRMADALAYRMAGNGEPAPEIRAYLSDPVTDLMKRSLEMAGVSTRGLSRDDIMMRSMNTTSDFPLVVSNAMGKVAGDAYKAAETVLKILCKSRNLTNFKESTSVRLGGMGRLEEISESGEIRHTSRAENGEGLRLKTFARGIDVSRKLLIDDDLGLLGDMTAALGTAAAQTEADLLVEILLGNGKLSDGKAVFHATRGNITDPSGLSVTALGESRKAMRKRTDLDGKTLINAQPKYLLVGPELEDWAEQVLANIYPATADGVNPFSGKLQLLVEPRITDGRWYVFADPARLPCLQYAHLASAPGVQIQRTEAWDVLGTKYRAWLDFGVGWLDWRGAQFNAGEA